MKIATSFTSILLEIQYLAPIQYYTKNLVYNNLYIEKQEHYNKGSFRNRTLISTANGLLCLSIPLVKGKHQQKPISSIKIDYSENWQKVHWRSIRTAYGRAPYFDYYASSIVPFYEKKYNFLFDYCLDLQEITSKLLSLSLNLHFTQTYKKEVANNLVDFRNKITPKTYSKAAQWDQHFQANYYPQVFEDRYGFIPNLSILDLLFCTGPEAILYLHSSVSKV